MGLFDGRLGTGGEASTAHVASLTTSPVLLVVDISHASRTHAAVVAGLAAFDPSVHIAGVILNKAGSQRHADEVRDALNPIGIPVLGVLPRDAGIATPSRHLGLVPAAERVESAHTLERMAEVIAAHLDIDAVLAVAREAAALTGTPWDPAQEIEPPSQHHRAVVAMAGGRAFTFRYPETEELLRAAGCDVVEFDPLTDAALPADTAGIYLGGGVPGSPCHRARRKPLLDSRNTRRDRCRCPHGRRVRRPALPVPLARRHPDGRRGPCRCRDDPATHPRLPNRHQPDGFTARRGRPAGHRPRIPPHRNNVRRGPPGVATAHGPRGFRHAHAARGVSAHALGRSPSARGALRERRTRSIRLAIPRRGPHRTPPARRPAPRADARRPPEYPTRPRPASWARCTRHQSPW